MSPLSVEESTGGHFTNSTYHSPLLGGEVPRKSSSDIQHTHQTMPQGFPRRLTFGPDSWCIVSSPCATIGLTASIPSIPRCCLRCPMLSSLPGAFCKDPAVSSSLLSAHQTSLQGFTPGLTTPMKHYTLLHLGVFRRADYQCPTPNSFSMGLARGCCLRSTTQFHGSALCC